MKHQNEPIFIISCFLFFLLMFGHFTILVKSQEVEDERDFDYVQGSKKGPAFWGEINREWAACKKGGMQSPVDLSNERVLLISSLVELKRNYKPSNATLNNRGHDIMLKWEGNPGSIQIAGVQYTLKQSHWHGPSEHSVNGIRYDMELHMVYQSQRKVINNIAVVGVLYQIGQPDAFLSKISRDVALMSDKIIERRIGVIDPAEIIQLDGNNYYRYIGSLTTPPCTEGVIWIISKQLRTVSREQIEILRVAVHDYAEMNARPVQPLNRRPIVYYRNPKDRIN